MSGYTANLLVEQGVPKRAIGNIHKPFTRRLLAEKIQKGLSQAKKNTATDGENVQEADMK